MRISFFEHSLQYNLYYSYALPHNFSPLFAVFLFLYIEASNIVNLAYAAGGVAFDKRINSVFRRFLSPTLYKLPLVTPLTHPHCLWVFLWIEFGVENN